MAAVASALPCTRAGEAGHREQQHAPEREQRPEAVPVPERIAQAPARLRQRLDHVLRREERGDHPAAERENAHRGKPDRQPGQPAPGAAGRRGHHHEREHPRVSGGAHGLVEGSAVVHPPAHRERRPRRQGREGGAREERLVRNRGTRKQPQKQAEDDHPPDADGENRTRLDGVRTVRKAGGDCAEGNCYGDQMPTGDHRKAQPAASKASARESLRRHPFQPIAALRALAAVAAIALVAAPAAQAQRRLTRQRPVRTCHSERPGQGQEEDRLLAGLHELRIRG